MSLVGNSDIASIIAVQQLPKPLCAISWVSLSEERVKRRGSSFLSASAHWWLLRSHTDAFRRGLQTLGYRDGQNITLEVRYTDRRSDGPPRLGAGGGAPTYPPTCIKSQ